MFVLAYVKALDEQLRDYGPVVQAAREVIARHSQDLPHGTASMRIPLGRLSEAVRNLSPAQGGNRG